MPSIHEILEIAKKAAAAARAVQIKGLTEGHTVTHKGRTNDLVTSADLESERVIRTLVHQHYPDHGFLGEESGHSSSESPWLWVVDPIDGTTNYARGIPFFCSSIAVRHEGRTVVGVVDNPIAGETFWAAEGQGAFLNGRPIQASTAEKFTEALMATGFYYDRGRNIELTLSGIQKFYNQGIMGLRRLGTCAMDLCYLAAGRFDGYFEIGINAWDFAAGEFIARQAGCTVTDEQGKPLGMDKSYIIAGSPQLHPQMLEILSDWRTTPRVF